MPSLRPATPAFRGAQGLTLNWAGLPQSAERSVRAATKERPGSAESKVGLSFGFKTKRKNIVSRAASTELETRLPDSISRTSPIIVGLSFKPR